MNMDGIPKIGSDNPLAPIPARSPLTEIYSRKSHDDQRSIPENAEPQPEGSVEEGKGVYVDLYA
jgi:hypothetical protein